MEIARNGLSYGKSLVLFKFRFTAYSLLWVTEVRLGAFQPGSVALLSHWKVGWWKQKASGVLNGLSRSVCLFRNSHPWKKNRLAAHLCHRLEHTQNSCSTTGWGHFLMYPRLPTPSHHFLYWVRRYRSHLLWPLGSFCSSAGELPSASCVSFWFNSFLASKSKLIFDSLAYAAIQSSGSCQKFQPCSALS